MEIKFVPLTPQIKRVSRKPWKYLDFRVKIEDLLALDGNDFAISLKLNEDEALEDKRKIVQYLINKYNQDLKNTILSMRTNKDDKIIYVFKKTKTGYDRYLRS